MWNLLQSDSDLATVDTGEIYSWKDLSWFGYTIMMYYGMVDMVARHMIVQNVSNPLAPFGFMWFWPWTPELRKTPKEMK